MQPIPLYNRQTRQLEQEAVYEAALMEFLFETRFGLWIAETFFKHRWATEFYARRMHSPRSRAKIRPFIEQNKIDVSELVRPIESFQSFNDFFIRQLKPSARPVDQTPDHLISPADARLLAYDIKHDTILPVKGRGFTVRELLRDDELADAYANGLCLIFRLAPVDYHRFGYVDDGMQMPVHTINGWYRSVNPLAIWQQLPVFSENQRESCVLETRNFGAIVHVDVGATSVGRMVQHQRAGGPCTRGHEKGYFEFGGSTSILLFKPNIVQLDADIAEYSSKGIETLVRYGERIGVRQAASLSAQ